MALKRRIKKLSKSEALKVTGRTFLVCSECDSEEVEVPSDIGRVTCARCVQKMVAPPPEVQKKSEGEKFPRGWHFKARYVHTDGKVYRKGVLTDETDTPVVTEKPKKKVVKKQVKKTIKKKGK
jgi:hypothetical protein